MTFPAHSSAPRWSPAPPPVDPSGATYGIVGFGDCAEVTSRWQATAGGWQLHFDRADSRSLSVLERELAAATVGLRLMLAGPEEDVLAAQASALAAGLIAAEVTVHATSAPTRKVYCVHCQATGSLAAPVAGVGRCPGCGRGLHVYPHFSRASGRYLGFQADAEELA